ncbi:MAG: NADH-quinone oxidoreductase subunit NuoE [Bacillota bacterium]|uniref:NADH-quinone oxidoreductase subunit NuoE n=1 Tax=Desulfurispora thermophila TaxID=265470 RepID=UPI0003671A25|nr:NADH-quinone oxidoreductase subunit NuoE [Desulfurispora thermophila]
MQLTAEEKQLAVETARRVAASHRPGKGSLIPVLQEIQADLGYVPAVAMQEVAQLLNVPAVDVYAVVTFYNQFRLTPPGRRQVKVCMGTACHMKGGQIILESWERRLNIKVGETTPDREYSLERVACVGCCTMAPVVLVNEEVHAKVTPTRVDGLLFAHQLAKEQVEGGKAIEQGGND